MIKHKLFTKKGTKLLYIAVYIELQDDTLAAAVSISIDLKRQYCFCPKRSMHNYFRAL